MCLSQANADLAEAAEKLEVIRKKLTVSLSLACSHSLSLHHNILSAFHKCALDNVKCVCEMWKELDDSLDTLKAAFEKATSEKLRCQDEVNHTNNTIKLANRLVKGLEVRIQYVVLSFGQ